MHAAITGLGTWLPEQVRTNEAWPESFEQASLAHADRTFNDIPPAEDPLSAAIVARDLAAEANDPFLGARRRRVADESIGAVEAEVRAARIALDDAGVCAEDVDLVLSNSLVPDRISPAAAGGVAHALGARRALGLGVEAACASGLAQLEIARAYLESGLARVVLLTQSHLVLRTFPLAHPACPGLGDGATAMVVTGGRGLCVRSTFGVTHGEHAEAVTWIRGSDDATDLEWWRAGGPFRIGSRAPAVAKRLMRDTVSYGAATLREAAARAGIELDQIAVLASVQPRGFLPGAIAERVGIGRERAITTYDEIAHVGVCGPVFNLARARALDLLQPGAFVALYGQGAGFTRVAAILEVTR